jgi:hypothetical protein
MTRVKDMRDDSLKLNKMLAAFQMMLWYVLAGVAYNGKLLGLPTAWMGYP